MNSKEVLKGYEIGKNEYVVMTQDERNSVRLNSIRSLEVEGFIPSDTVEPIKMEKNHYILPQEGAEKPYSLLVEILKQTKRFALTRITARGSERVAVIRAKDNNLVLTTMLYNDEVYPTPEIPQTELSEKEKKLGLQLVEGFKLDEVEWDKYHNRYVEALQELIEAKQEGRPIPEAIQPEAPASLDLTKALEMSIKAVKEEKPIAAVLED